MYSLEFTVKIYVRRNCVTDTSLKDSFTKKYMGKGAGLYTRNATQRIVKRITLVCDLGLADFFLLFTISAKLIRAGSFLYLVYSRVTPLPENFFNLVRGRKGIGR